MTNGLALMKKESTKHNLMRKCFNYSLVLDLRLVAKLVYRNFPQFNSS